MDDTNRNEDFQPYWGYERLDSLPVVELEKIQICWLVKSFSYFQTKKTVETNFNMIKLSFLFNLRFHVLLILKSRFSLVSSAGTPSFERFLHLVSFLSLHQKCQKESTSDHVCIIMTNLFYFTLHDHIKRIINDELEQKRLTSLGCFRLFNQTKV